VVIASSVIFTLCDNASIRDGLLSVLSSGVNQIVRSEFPDELASYVAIQLQIEGFGDGDTFVIEVVVTDMDGTPTEVADFSVDFTDSLSADQSFPFTFPFVLDARQLPVPAAQPYRMALKLNGTELSHFVYYGVLMETPAT